MAVLQCAVCSVQCAVCSVLRPKSLIKIKIKETSIEMIHNELPVNIQQRMVRLDQKGLSTLVTVGTPTLTSPGRLAGHKRSVDYSLSRDVNMASEQARYFLKVLDLNRKDLDYNDVKNHIMLDDPSTFKEAMSQVDSAQWLEALQIEYENLKRKGVLKEVLSVKYQSTHFWGGNLHKVPKVQIIGGGDRG